MDDLYKLNVATFMYKYNNEMLPSLFVNMFYTNADNHKYNTRFPTNFEFPNNKLEFGDKSISDQGFKILNSIPSYIKNAKRLHLFKSNYKATLISQYR